MITVEKARELAAEYIKPCKLAKQSGETATRYVFTELTQEGEIFPGGADLTVDKESGECRHEFLPREGKLPWSPIKGYKKIDQ